MLLPFFAFILAVNLTGRVVDPQGKPVRGAVVRACEMSTTTVEDGSFSLAPGAISCEVSATASGFQRVSVRFGPSSDNILLQFSAVARQSNTVTVTADAGDAGLLAPDPSIRVMVRQETLDANPGRPGFPVSIPGMPVESPAGGIKPPQYFVPGVAGDHGEPIAQFFQVGGYLFPNNLPANAHGNGYADPNTLIPLAIESVAADGGAFNVREGNNSVNAATIFGLRERLEPTLRITADYRDVNAVTGWSPRSPAIKEWVGLEFSFGNGFLDRLEHRKQYKFNASRTWTIGKHDLTVYGIGYKGFSFLPGLIPVGVKVPGDTYDSRQSEEASSGVLIANDIWRVSPATQVQLSGFFRTYQLDVRPNFGDGWLRQTENRLGGSGNALVTHRISRAVSVLAGAEHRIDAPHGLYLYKYDESAKRFDTATGNDLTLQFLSPFFALDGGVGKYLRYDIGLRFDEVFLNNRDLLAPTRSFHSRDGVASPKATMSFNAKDEWFVPSLSLSYGQAFHVNDPRIGLTGDTGHTLIDKSRSYQLVVRKTVAKTDLRLTLIHTTVGQQLARINNDTGLQEDVGPALIKSAVLSARRAFSWGSLQASFAKADSRDRIDGTPIPEAPRLIWDGLGTLDRLPFHLQFRGEFEFVGRKPLGDGFDSVSVREFRGALFRAFESRGIDVGVNFFIASGYGGQTLETLALRGEAEPMERVTGYPLRSYVTASISYKFRHR